MFFTKMFVNCIVIMLLLYAKHKYKYMIHIKPKFSGKELEILRERLDRRAGIAEASRITGINRNTIRQVMIGGVCSDKTAKAIKEQFLGIKHKKNAAV